MLILKHMNNINASSWRGLVVTRMQLEVGTAFFFCSVHKQKDGTGVHNDEEAVWQFARFCYIYRLGK